ncbi:low molecular weight protein arginine phosphatase [Tepidibacillus infernus]|uniref:Phosphotyrosine protein phosphatase I domain-containing protein n=1 Tax=Tepidibacillus decaturensis TaxID=1413211 RepID=A0A135L6M3_9BACI|nr:MULTISPECIES: low molecular weight protein arginine phosphatase [Tepidibacillus]KXG44664.1 hypothetical protein U473_12000 [Tepidibacillus decaturensis]GBF11802.1 low molecular weight protein-tyrosine-phosphatase YwlE [Tepidibacillus sp. HK-1]
MNVLFVCTGNTCRSPMAEKILKKIATDEGLELAVKSAGILAIEDLPASEHARTVMQEYGVEDDHSAKKVTRKLLKWADLVFTMTEGHKQVLVEQYPEFIEKIKMLKESGDISDPFGNDLEVYRETAKEIEAAIRTFLDRRKIL